MVLDVKDMASVLRQKAMDSDESTALIKNSCISFTGTDPYPFGSVRAFGILFPSVSAPPTEFAVDALRESELFADESRAEPLDEELLGVLMGFVPGCRLFNRLIGSKPPSSTIARLYPHTSMVESGLACPSGSEGGGEPFVTRRKHQIPRRTASIYTNFPSLRKVLSTSEALKV